jgi:4-amino-4-deoxy-L-arabinose transferase-like glycosyltransferase
LTKINTRGDGQLGTRFFACALAVLVCLFAQLGAIGLVGPDEPRYAWIARAMAETGDWVTPRLYGQPWFEKPILYYWTAGIGFALHLSAEWAARLPSAMAALLAAVTIGWLGWKHYSRDLNSMRSPALLAPLLFATGVAAIGFARAATPDMLFAACLTLAMASAASALDYGAAESGENSSRGWQPLLLFGIFLGFAVLAKGPAAIVLAAGAIALWTLATRHWRAAFRLAHPLAIAAFCVVALPWYIVCAIRNPDFLRVFILQHNFERYLTPVFHHRQPIWFFGPVVLAALLPWTALLWPVAQEGLRLWRDKSWTRSPGFFFACWAVFPVLFFSFSESKLPSYILPAIPPLALLCAAAFIRAFDRSKTLATALAAAIGVSWIVLAIAAFLAARRLDWSAAVPNFRPHSLAVDGCTTIAIALIVGAAMVACGRRRLLEPIAWIAAICAVISLEALNTRVLPVLDHFDSARSHAQFMRNDLHPDRIFIYELRRDWDYGLAFYFRRQLPAWSPDDPGPALVLTNPAGLADIEKHGRFHGQLEERYVGILYVPVETSPR